MALAVMVGIVLGLCSRLINFQFPSQVSWFAAPGAALGLCIQHKQAPGIDPFGEVWMLDVEGRQYKWPTHEIQAYFMRQGLAIYTWGTGCFFQVRIFLNLFWEVFCCIELTNIEKPFSWSDSDWWTLPLWARQSLHFLIWLMAAIFFALMEIDRISGESTVKEAQQLRQGYQGSIQYAECARQSDALKIHDEIDCQQDAVDYAIHVLMTAGMSTPALRHVAQAGVDIEFAAYSEITAACIILIPYELVSVVLLVFHTMYFSGEWSMLILQSISIFARLILLLLILWSPQDDQCFALKLLTKLAAVLVIVFAICFLLQWVSDLSEGSFKPTLLWLQVSDIGLLCLIPIASLGIHGTAERLPFGRCLLQLVFARGRKAFAFCGFFQCSNLQPCCCHKYLAPRHSDTESAESSE